MMKIYTSTYGRVRTCDFFYVLQTGSDGRGDLVLSNGDRKKTIRIEMTAEEINTLWKKLKHVAEGNDD